MTATTTAPAKDPTARIEQLNRASLRRVIEPDEEVTGNLTKDQVIPDDLLSVDGLGLELTPEQRATLDAFVLVGEEIPDLFQKLAAEHPDTAPYVREVSRYPRMEEARHIAFARTTVGEHYRKATWTDRYALRRLVPLGIVAMFDMMVQPFVYPTVGLPAFQTWRK